MTAAAAVWTPPRLAQAPDHDALWNAVVSLSGAVLPLAGRSAAAFTLTEAPAEGAMALRLRSSSGLAFAALPDVFPFAALCGADLTVADLSVVPVVLRDALLEGMVTVVTSALPPNPHGPITIEQAGSWAEIGADMPDAAALRWYRVAVQGLAPEPIVFSLAATLPVLAAAFGALSPRRVWTGLKARLTQQAYVTLGRLQLPTRELRALRIGSVIVIAAGFDRTGMMIRCDDTLYRFSATGQGWTCMSIEADGSTVENMSMADASNPTPVAAGASQASKPLPLDVRIDLDVGTVVVPLAEVETWQPGSIVALQPVPAVQGVEVTLRSNGRSIGTGDLVTIDDRIAVRISSLLFGE